MPKIADIEVVTSTSKTIVFRVLSSSPGDGGMAQWRADASTPSVAPVIRMKTVPNGNNTARRSEVSGSFIFAVPKDGLEVGVARVPFRFTATIPDNVPSTFALEASEAITRALASTQIAEAVATGFAPT